ncbi:MAG TPA: zinc-binding alcohol dehydrogenase [Planctomycetota bacterium]|nr:zinc-binding alcohol dehydrogenase [Planctomycetota bacterium]
MPASLAYWVDTAGQGALHAVELPHPGDTDVDLQTQFSGISPGTERLVGLGQVPSGSASAMACRGMRGSFALPILYGYSLVGVVRGGALDGQRAFVMHPHQQRVIVPRATLVMLPADVPSPRGTLLPNLETALNATWDAELRAGERIAVIGGGAVGLLVAFVLSSTHRGEVVLVEAEAARRQFAARLPWVRAAVAPEELAPGTFAVAFHATGTSHGLQLAIDALSFEGRVIELSWYGTKTVELRLGGTFHSERKRIVASQVGTVAASHREAGFGARTAAVLQLLRDARLDALLQTPIAFARLPEFFARLYRGEQSDPCPLVVY